MCRVEMVPTFKVVSGDFAAEDRHRGGGGKVVEDAELEAILNEDLCQTQEELAEPLDINERVISKRLEQLEICWKGKRERDFYIVLLLDTKNRYITIAPSGAEKHGARPMVILLRQHLGRISMAQKSCFADGDVIYYELLKPSEIITNVAPSDFHLTHLVHWHTAWLTSTSARMKN
nr:histone lysine N methyltransferase SETMAR [Hymenolepis microstoma]